MIVNVRINLGSILVVAMTLGIRAADTAVKTVASSTFLVKQQYTNAGNQKWIFLVLRP